MDEAMTESCISRSETDRCGDSCGASSKGCLWTADTLTMIVMLQLDLDEKRRWQICEREYVKSIRKSIPRKRPDQHDVRRQRGWSCDLWSQGEKAWVNLRFGGDRVIGPHWCRERRRCQQSRQGRSRLCVDMEDCRTRNLPWRCLVRQTIARASMAPLLVLRVCFWKRCPSIVERRRNRAARLWCTTYQQRPAFPKMILLRKQHKTHQQTSFVFYDTEIIRFFGTAILAQAILVQGFVVFAISVVVMMVTACRRGREC